MRWTLAGLITSTLLAASIAAFTAPGCSQNEAIVCSSDWSGAAGTSCSATYNLCKGGAYKVECAPKTPETVECKCIEDSVQKTTFTSDDACKVPAGSLKQRARDGCHWTLD